MTFWGTRMLRPWSTSLTSWTPLRCRCRTTGSRSIKQSVTYRYRTVRPLLPTFIPGGLILPFVSVLLLGRFGCVDFTHLFWWFLIFTLFSLLFLLFVLVFQCSRPTVSKLLAIQTCNQLSQAQIRAFWKKSLLWVNNYREVLCKTLKTWKSVKRRMNIWHLVHRIRIRRIFHC